MQWELCHEIDSLQHIFDKPKIRPKYSLGTGTWSINVGKTATIAERKKSIQ